MIVAWLIAGALLLLTLVLAVWNRRLGERVADRNHLAAELAKSEEAEAAMRAARDLAESAARVKSDFFANMSHEIRTPMNAVIGLSSLLLKTDLTAHQRGYLMKIQQAAQMLLEIVNDILDFSKLEAGKFGFEQTEFEPDEIFDRVGNLIGSKAAAKGLELIFNVDPRLKFALIGDPLRLSQIFVNYVTNAVKFTDQGEVELIVELREETDGEVLLYCAVRDTGIGLSEAQRASLFQPFQQADTSITRKYGGTGLGLVICKSLAEAMGGAVGVDSNLGKGSTFWFTARLGKGAIDEALVPASDLCGLRVLVVDDHPRAREVVADNLGSMGFAVATAATGHQAVDMVTAAAGGSAPFTLVLLDSEMADSDGFEAAARINALGLAPSPHLILMIGAWGEEVTEEARQVGVDYLLPKPFTPSLLLNMISHAVHDPEGGQRAEPEPGRPAEPNGPASWHGRHILLVEDNELNQEVALGLLGGFGFAVELAADGSVAVDKVLSREPRYYAAVLMDMQMPVMDGLTATRRIRSFPSYDGLPIIAMTANARAADRNRCAAAGMNDLVAKPIEPHLLWATLVRWIGGQTPSMPASAPGSEPSLPAIAGLDAAAGLGRMMGNTANYIVLLRKFAERHAADRAEIDGALRAGDRATAERLAHTLKGVAGNVGALALAAQAQQVESAIHTGADAGALAADLGRLGDTLAALIAELRGKLPHDKTATTAGSAFDRERANQASRELAGLLARSDVAALAFLTENSAILRHLLGKHFREIEAATEGFDFAAALGALKRAASDLEIAL